MTDEELLDACWAIENRHNDHRPLWDSDVEQLERWPTTGVEATAAARAELLEARARALAAVDGSDLGPSLRTVADALLLVAAELDVVAEHTMPHADLGLHSYLFWAVNDMPLRTAAHGDRYLAKLAAFPAAIEQLTGRLAVAARGGRAPLARHAARAVERLEDHLALPVGDDPLLAQAPPSDLAADDEGWRDRVAAAVRADVRPALTTLRDTLRDVSLPAGRSDDAPGLCHVPGGERQYAELLAAYVADGATPEDVHATGLAQVERLAAEYREVGGPVFGVDDTAAVLDRLRSDPSLAHTSAAEVVAEATALHARAEEAAPRWFATVPEAACRVRSTDHGSMGFYSPPSRDGSRPGVFYLNTSEPGVWGPNLATTVFHEGVPGHHFQAALAIEDETLHAVHRRLFLPAFGEGWALYAERLADEMGLFADEVQRLGMLSADSLRACRLVVDTGLHAFGWSRDRAIAYLRDNSPLSEAQVVAEIDRYIAMPGQATSYMMGRLTIEELRDDARARLGERFDTAAFHAVVLGHGMVSLPALRAVVEGWDGGAGLAGPSA